MRSCAREYGPPKQSRPNSLRADADILQERIGNLVSRGVSAAADAALESIIAERLPMYERFGDLTINGQNAELVLANLLQALADNKDLK